MNEDRTYVPNPHDNTSNETLLIPPTVWMQLMCKRPKDNDVTRRRDEVVLHRPRCPYLTTYEADRWVFTPLSEPSPAWTIVRGFYVGSYVLEAFTAQYAGDSLLMWDLGGQERYRAGEILRPAIVTAMRT